MFARLHRKVSRSPRGFAIAAIFSACSVFFSAYSYAAHSYSHDEALPFNELEQCELCMAGYMDDGAALCITVAFAAEHTYPTFHILPSPQRAAEVYRPQQGRAPPR